MKRIFNIFITCALLVSLLGGAGFLTASCTPEDQPGTDQPSGGEGEGEKEEPSVPGAPAAFSKFISTISKNFLTKALPWGTGKPANADIKYKVIWK